MLKNETSFRLELVVFVFATLFIVWIELSVVEKLLMFSAVGLVLVAEALNSAIERVVDLVTLEYHDMAKRAKDAASAAVLFSVIICATIWVVLLYQKL